MTTNAAEYLSLLENWKPKYPVLKNALAVLRGFGKRLREQDDFDWAQYNDLYRAQFAWTRSVHTVDLRKVDFRLIDGKLFTIGDAKPLHPAHRAIWEALAGLPALGSVAEIGVGAGFLCAGAKTVLGGKVRMSAYDIDRRQLQLFREVFPEVFAEAHTGVLDLTLGPIPEKERPDAVFASTVLMHIQREEAYRAALANLFASASRFFVLMDNWTTHDYFADLQATAAEKAFKGTRLYAYDSGASVVVVGALAPCRLPKAYVRLTSPEQLLTYHRKR